jgi:5S rRNA maturation endonuclease (ribonuclease M5)
MAGGEVRAFYEALGIELPGWARTEAPVRCFADPTAHRRDDRDASCSVNVHSGAFNCHGCGARGGAYDAALARGRSPREAIDLMVAFGLTERRQRDPSRTTSPASTRDTSRSPARQRTDRRAQTATAPASLAVTGEQVEEWAEQLERSPGLLARLARERGWSRRALVDLEIGFDGERITVPIWRSAAPADRAWSERAGLQGLLRLRLDRTGHPKVTAVPGTRLGLLPLPAWTREERVLLVEGPSDMLAARSAGLPAIAVPGANAWRSEWASALDGRRVVLVMDCDRPGRQAAARIAQDLERRGIQVGICDLAPSRHDGYDVSDWLREGNTAAQLLAAHEPHSASAYRRTGGVPNAVAAVPGPRPAPHARPGAERAIAAGVRSVWCRAF